MKCTMCWVEIDRVSIVKNSMGDVEEKEMCKVCAKVSHGENYMGSAFARTAAAAGPLSADELNSTGQFFPKFTVTDSSGNVWRYEKESPVEDHEPIRPDDTEDLGKWERLSTPLTVNEFIRLLKAGLTFVQIVYLKQEGII